MWTRGDRWVVVAFSVLVVLVLPFLRSVGAW